MCLGPKWQGAARVPRNCAGRVPCSFARVSKRDGVVSRRNNHVLVMSCRCPPRVSFGLARVLSQFWGVKRRSCGRCSTRSVCVVRVSIGFTWPCVAFTLVSLHSLGMIHWFRFSEHLLRFLPHGWERAPASSPAFGRSLFDNSGSLDLSLFAEGEGAGAGTWCRGAGAVLVPALVLVQCRCWYRCRYRCRVGTGIATGIGVGTLVPAVVLVPHGTGAGTVVPALVLVPGLVRWRECIFSWAEEGKYTTISQTAGLGSPLLVSYNVGNLGS